ncbi:MAG: GDSL family lipase [Solirubrobacteraceae bacterium]|nr:GDSL family lipase [Solirubrobacteraceae bacterium]
MRRGRLALLLALAALALPAAPAAAAAPACPASHWVAAWTAAPTDAATGGVQDQTLRQVVVPHGAGDRARLRLSNRFGAEPLTVDRTTIGRRAGGGGAAVEPGTLVPVTFGGRAAVTIPPGGEVVSDPIPIAVAPLRPLLVSTYFASGTGPLTEHYYARQVPHIASGDRTGEASGEGFDALDRTSAYVVAGLDVLAPGSVGAVVAFGDSLTDGYVGAPRPGEADAEAIGADGAYPDALQRRLLGAQGAPPLVVVNAGISGNRILDDGLIPEHGRSMLARLHVDALALPGVTTVILQGGANDLGAGEPDAGRVIAGLADLVARARAAGKRVLLATMTPAEGARPASYGDAAAEAARAAVNAWIRSGAAGDDVGIVDFDAALRDPARPGRLRPELDSGDGLHPNLAGYRAMAEAVDLALLAAPACACRVRPALRVRVPARLRGRLRSAVVTVDGRRVGTIRRPGQSVRVDLRRARGSQVVIRMRVRLSGGRTVTRVQRLPRCLA